MMSNKFRLLFSLPKTIVFNFHYLPLKQAIKLPIWLYNVKIIELKGKIILDTETIKPGMIKLGTVANPLYESRNRFCWENRGTICFKGICIIGHGSGVSTGNHGYIEIGNNFIASTTIKIISYKSIIIGENGRVAWESIIMDTDFHETINCETGKRSNPTKPIKIGNNNWIGVKSLVLKGTETPDFCIAGAYTLLNKKYEVPQYSLIVGNPAKLVKVGVYRDLTSEVE